ncbi:MAG: hypothetical protein ABFC67_02995 [Mizugakiibacter sp.]|uniref:hypothetical protein n=1 Tax=Mizugakiibacter sp. TaxID=1972610 RepID=UPI0031CAE917|nr:hypothetical protein [Xanthomonadaceae bacterium]
MLMRMRAWLLPFALLPLAVANAAVHYRLRYDAADASMAVALCSDAAQAELRLIADDDAPRYVSGLVRDSGAPVVRAGGAWVARDWRAGECLRYRADLGRIAAAQRPDVGWRRGDDLLTSPTLWLLQPADAGRADAEVALPAGYALSAPWQPLPADAGARCYRIALTPLDWAATVAVGRFVEMPLALPGGTLRIAIMDGADAAQRAALRAWLARVSQAVLDGYGRLPIPDVQVLVVPVSRRHGGDAVVFGESTRGQGHALILRVDPAAPPEAFADDWIAVHELSHLFHPYLGDDGRWLAEGLATYYQEVLRARAGLIGADDAWGRLDAGFARGRADAHPGMTLDAVSERMMDLRAFMRVYWAGTAYWLQADAALRRASGGRLSVDVALARFRDCCLPSHRAWTPAAFVAKLDALTGGDSFARRYRAFANATAFPDLAPTYAALGLRAQADGALHIGGDVDAAALRDAIMAPSRTAGAAAVAR